MKQQLSEQDWERVIFAISQYSHNSDFQDTLDRLLKALGRSQAT